MQDSHQQHATPVHAWRCAVLATAIKQGVFSDATPSAIFMDADAMRALIKQLHNAGYPGRTLHTVAVKANPVGSVLQVFRDNHMGAEVASMGELAQALHVGFAPNTIVFDSPAKTVAEIQFACKAGVRMNLDNFQELERTAAIIQANPEPLNPSSCIGLRINPQIGAGSIAALSTGGLISKFGIPLTEARQQIVEAFVNYPWLNMLHLHVGSQGLPASRIVDGVERVWQLLQEVDAACGGGRVKVLDIGGGLTVDFASDQQPEVSVFQEQAALLRARIPALFEERCPVQVVTENGRSLLAKAGFVASKVEATKSSGGRHIAVTHIGADLLTRMCYLPETWSLRLFVCDPSGASKEAAAGVPRSTHGVAGSVAAIDEAAAGQAGPAVSAAGTATADSRGPAEADGSSAAGPAEAVGAHSRTGAGAVDWVEQDVAGPLCFQGDRLAVGKLLPRTRAGDYIMVVDVGAYTLSMYSRYNSRQSPPVYGFSKDGSTGLPLLSLWRAGDTMAQVLQFWNQQ